MTYAVHAYNGYIEKGLKTTSRTLTENTKLWPNIISLEKDLDRIGHRFLNPNAYTGEPYQLFNIVEVTLIPRRPQNGKVGTFLYIREKPHV